MFDLYGCSGRNDGDFSMKRLWFAGQLIYKRKIGKRGKWTLRGSVHLVRAHNPEEAYDKLFRLGESQCLSEHSFCSGTQCIFLGLSQLSPIYDRIEDGVEILETMSIQGTWRDINDAASCFVHCKRDLIDNLLFVEKNRVQDGMTPMFSESSRLRGCSKRKQQEKSKGTPVE